MVQYHKAFLSYYSLDDFVDFIQAMDTAYMDELNNKLLAKRSSKKK